ncbi:MAG: flippase-like domain-containing protein [Verrucomicrobiaceae bacterium]|nr:flippase-like domain-containing protein [Verrucomicrobiaceae bacterium]
MKRLLPALLKLAVSAVLLILIFRGQEGGSEILPRLRLMLTNWGWTTAGLTCVAASILLHSWRWQALLKGQSQPAHLGQIARINICAAFFSLSPLGAAGGDAWRIISLMKDPRFKRLPVVVSIVLDHFVGLASLALLYVFFVTAFAEHWESHPPAVQHLVSGFSVFMGGSLLFLLLSVWSFSPGLYAWGETRFPRLLGNEKVKQFCQACDAMRSSWARSLEALLASIAMFATHFATFYCSARAISEHPPFKDVMAAMPIVDGLAGLPVSFAGLGVREKTFEALMGALSGMGESAAVSAALAGWLMQVFWAILGGLLFVLNRHRLPSPS